MKIKQPNNITINNGKTSLNLKWNPSFANTRNNKLHLAQCFVDSECIRLMEPYTPFDSGMLARSTRDTKIGSGMIEQNAPYARYQYYGKLMVSSKTGSSYAKSGESKVLTSKDLQYSTARHSKAGKLWFKRMAADRGKAILMGTAKIAGGKVK